MSNIAYRVSEDTATAFFGAHGQKQITSTHPNFHEVVDLLTGGSDNVKQLMDLMAPVKAVEKALNRAESNGYMAAGQVTFDYDAEVVRYNGVPVISTLADKVIALAVSGGDIRPFLAFMTNLFMNPSTVAIDELFLFLEAGDLPITADGRFIAYKRVRNDYRDLHSGTFDNSPGQKPSMPRSAVDADRSRLCSTGLHVCSWSYLPHFGSRTGDRVVAVAVNPADVVAVPADYNNAKMRVWTYEVLADVTEAANEGPLAWAAAVVGEGAAWDAKYQSDESYDPDWDDDDDEDFYDDDEDDGDLIVESESGEASLRRRAHAAGMAALNEATDDGASDEDAAAAYDEAYEQYLNEHVAF